MACLNRLIRCPELIHLVAIDCNDQKIERFDLFLDVKSPNLRSIRCRGGGLACITLPDDHPLEGISVDGYPVVRVENNRIKHQTLVELLGDGWGSEFTQKHWAKLTDD